MLIWFEPRESSTMDIQNVLEMVEHFVMIDSIKGMRAQKHSIFHGRQNVINTFERIVLGLWKGDNHWKYYGDLDEILT